MPRPRYELAGIPLESPLVNTAGLINGVSAEDVKNRVGKLARTAIGAMTLGSITLSPRLGNEVKYDGIMYHHNPETGKTLNAMALPNFGLKTAVQSHDELVELAEGKPLIWSLAPDGSPHRGRPKEQLKRMTAAIFAAGAGLVELNLSCPNVSLPCADESMQLGHSLGDTAAILEAVKGEADSAHQVGVKLPPYLSDDHFEQISTMVKIFKANRVKFITTSNTLLTAVPSGDPEAQRVFAKLPEPRVGLSGPATAEAGQEQLRIWHGATDGQIDIISTLGVSTGQELATRLSMGAAAGGGVTFFRQNPNWSEAVPALLRDFYTHEAHLEANARRARAVD